VHSQVTGDKARRHAEATAVSDELTVLRDEFPEYRIWREETPGRSRYVARSRYQGASPHTVVTGQVTELRDALELGGHLITTQPTSFSPTEPNIARMYGYWLQEKDHYAADRAAADAITEQFPEVAAIARANRAFLGRAVRFAARQGIRQFLDLGCGLPISPNVHEIAQWADPGARVVYVDRDPVVLAHARALLAADENVSVVAGDIRDPGCLLRRKSFNAGIDADAPVCVLLVSVLHFLAPGEADSAVAAYRAWMPPGSYLVISAGTSTGTASELIRCLQDSYGEAAPVTGRTESEIAAWFDGLALARPGLADVWAWRPEGLQPTVPGRARFLAGAGRKTTVDLGWAP
jgi:O-methyltransferase involved in polyketide biosynthesis